jgi:hypothetical protein
MKRRPLRRGQVIAPFGVGAMNTYPDGVALMVAGLDAWFPKKLQIVVEEFRVDEPRLARALRVDHFRLPPDYRERDGESPNTGIRLPAVRFPRATPAPGATRWTSVRSRTTPAASSVRSARERGRFGRLSQVQIVVACEAGHIEDFPWREWCHSSISPACEGRLSVSTSGTTATLASTRVKCECGASRSLAQATGFSASASGPDEGTVDSGTKGFSALSRNLAEGVNFLCRGTRPWLGEERGPGDCRMSLHVTLRSAVNTYFADVRSAIFVPVGTSDAPSELFALMRNEPMRTGLRTLCKVLGVPNAEMLRLSQQELLAVFTDADIEEVADLVARELGFVTVVAEDGPEEDADEQSFRLAEAQAMLVSGPTRT